MEIQQFWYKDFDGMAYKTMLRQLISKWGIMSIEMQEGYTKDMAEIKENGDYNYIDVASDEDNNIEVNKEESNAKISDNQQNINANENENIEMQEEQNFEDMNNTDFQKMNF